MKARIIKYNGFYVGEVYGTWKHLLFDTEWTGWEPVTESCFTKWGAEQRLKAWKRNQYPNEFEI